MKLKLTLGEVEWIYFFIDGKKFPISTCTGADFILDLSLALQELQVGNSTVLKGWLEGYNLVLDFTVVDSTLDLLKIRVFVEDEDTFVVMKDYGTWDTNLQDFEEQCAAIFDFCKLNKKEYEKVTGLKLPKNL